MANSSILQYPAKQQFKITVPKGLVLAKGWKKGDKLSFSIVEKGNIVISSEPKKISKKTTLQLLNDMQFILTLPKELVLAKRWKSGDVLEFILTENSDLLLRRGEIK